MIMSGIRFFLLIGLCLLVDLGYGQDFTGYIQPTVALNYKVTPFYSHNFAINSRNFWFKDEESTLKAKQLDLVHFSNLKLMDNQSVAFGVQYRFRSFIDTGENELRLTQQYNYTQKPFIVRFGQRFRTEQRITKSNTVHRFRYRFSVDFPLNGERIDIGEGYLVGNLESLLSIGKHINPEYDQRATLQLGWLLSNSIKFQVGTEYRLEDLTDGKAHILMFLSALNLSL